MRKDWPQVSISDVQVGNKDRQNILVGEALKLRRKFISAPSIRSMCASKLITAKPITAAFAILP